MKLAAITDRPAPDWLGAVNPTALAPLESGIVKVFNYGRGKPGLIPLWVGEGDMPTPAFISDAARQSLDNGETFYTWQRGMPDLRQAIARYMSIAYPQEFSPESFFVTIGGMHALSIAIRLVAGPGDETIALTPAWPNYAGAIAMFGARCVEVPLDFGARWSLDVDKLARAVTPATRAIAFNSPANPTGYVATLDELRAVLGLARRHGLWIIADEIYGRIVYSGARAPSFHDIAAPEDKLLYVQTLSKNWAMTGWRIGWLEAPPALGQAIENLIQYTTSGVPMFIQRAAVAALAGGEEFLARQIAQMRRNRDCLAQALLATGRVRLALPEGAFYIFCAFDNFADSQALALRLVDEANVGVAPGGAFGAAGEGFLRLCFARAPTDIDEAARRLSDWLAAQA